MVSLYVYLFITNYKTTVLKRTGILIRFDSNRYIIDLYVLNLFMEFKANHLQNLLMFYVSLPHDYVLNKYH